VKRAAWHFVADTLRDGRPVPKDGVWLEHTGYVRMCETGLHASLQPFDALQFAPGPVLCLVDVDDIVAEDDDKLVCRKRRIVARMDATEMLRYFARMQAVSVIHLWDAPDVVCDYLITGDGAIRAAARAAAWDAGDAAWAAAWAAGAAGDAARGAAWAAAWAAGAAARGAARAAAWGAAWDAARAAAWGAARDAARIEFNQLVYECFEDYV
jgi:hypothetical protein